jgi:hypothetical protein
MWLKALVVWFLLLAVAVMNGALREVVLTPVFGAPWAHVLSTLLLSSLVLGLAAASAGWIGARNDAEAVRVGVLWTGLVLAFEFLAGHFLFGRSWASLLADYDVAAGRIWVLVPIVTLFAPIVALRMRKGCADASVAH